MGSLRVLVCACVSVSGSLLSLYSSKRHAVWELCYSINPDRACKGTLQTDSYRSGPDDCEDPPQKM